MYYYNSINNKQPVTMDLIVMLTNYGDFIMTRIVNNSQCTHSFFYCDPETVNQDYTFGTQCSFGKSFSDEENNILNFYSYYTKVAMLYKSKKDNQTYLLINWGSMTPTTGKHLSYLRSSNPYYITINVPFVYGEHSTSLRTIVNNLIKEIQDFYHNKELLYKKANREYWEEVVKAFTDLEYYIGLDEDDMQYFDLIEEVKAFIDSDSFIQKKKEVAKQKAAKTRQENKEKIEQEKQLIAEYKEKYTYYELVNICCNWDSPLYQGTTHQDKQLIANKILHTSINYQGNNCTYNALIWFAGDKVKTSKHITVNKEDVITLLKLYKHNKLKHGMMIDCYTVLEVMEDYVRIGCHKIPVANINALWEEYQKELTIKEVA